MLDTLLARNLVPDGLIRIGIRRLLAQRLRDETASSPQEQESRHAAFVAALAGAPVATHTRESREQHYEVPTPFYERVLGPRLKYSCCWFEQGNESLAEAEEAMLQLYVERAQLEDGQDVLELGCGWGSLSLWLASRHPRSRITAVSHSRTQREFIEVQAHRRGLANLTVITCDMNDFTFPQGGFDRVVSVEMFEHMKNWPRLFAGIAQALRPGGVFFLHIFTHRTFAYHFVARDESDWMSRYFFTGGMMPSERLATEFQAHLQLAEQWRVNGRHYALTAERWLEKMDCHRADLWPLFEQTYGVEARKWWSYWRIFFLSCAELWAYRDGEEWTVSHYRFVRP